MRLDMDGVGVVILVLLLTLFCSFAVTFAGIATNGFGLLASQTTSAIFTENPTDPSTQAVTTGVTVSPAIVVPTTPPTLIPTSAPPTSPPTPAPTSAPAPYRFLPYLDRVGGDIAWNQQQTLQACQAQCDATVGCSGIVYDTSSKQCWLKSGVSNAGIGMGIGTNRGLGFVAANNILPSVLQSPGRLNNSSALVSPSGSYAFLMQSDGNAVVYSLSTGKSLWSSGTNGKGNLSLAVQSDGNNVLYDGSRPVWATNDNNVRPAGGQYTLSMQDDGNLVSYNAAGAPVWASQSIVTLYSDCNYGGKSTSVQPGFYSVMPNGFPNDALSSLKVQGPVTVILYVGTNFTGKSFTVKSDNACLTSFNDVTSSLKVLGTF